MQSCTALSRSKNEKVSSDWRLVPAATLLGERRQFFIQGQGLEGSELSAGPSVTLEPGAVRENGKWREVHITIAPLRRSEGVLPVEILAKGEHSRSWEEDRPGRRFLMVRTDKGPRQLPIEVIDEKAFSD